MLSHQGKRCHITESISVSHARPPHRPRTPKTTTREMRGEGQEVLRDKRQVQRLKERGHRGRGGERERPNGWMCDDSLYFDLTERALDV